MQSSAVDLIQRAKVLNLYKHLYKHLKFNKMTATSGSISMLEEMRNEFREHSLTDSKYCMQKNEMFFLGNAYLTYLSSTERTLQLYARFSKGERSIEESARIVGLKLPKQYDPEQQVDKRKE